MSMGSINTQEIEEEARQLFAGETFEGVFARDKLPMKKKKRNRLFIMNTDTSNLPGTHWIAVCVRNGTGYCFDPLGKAPPSTLINWFDRLYPLKPWSCNAPRQIQPDYSKLCGFYCLYFLYWCSASYLNEINTNTIVNILFPTTHTRAEHDQKIKEFFKSSF